MPSGQSITTTEPGAQARASQQPQSLSHPSPQPCRLLTHPGPELTALLGGAASSPAVLHRLSMQVFGTPTGSGAVGSVPQGCT